MSDAEREIPEPERDIPDPEQPSTSNEDNWVEPSAPWKDPSHPCHYLDVWVNTVRIMGHRLGSSLRTLFVEHSDLFPGTSSPAPGGPNIEVQNGQPHVSLPNWCIHYLGYFWIMLFDSVRILYFMNNTPSGVLGVQFLNWIANTH